MSFNKAEFEEVQKERQEYVENIGIEYRYGCYEEKRSDSCHLLGEYMEAVMQKFDRAYALFKENCELRKYPRSCYKYATYRLSGKECEPSLKEMIKPLEVACAANLPPACRLLSLVYWNGEPDRPPDSFKAETFMKKACELEDAEACWLLSTWYIGDKKFAVSKGGSKKDFEPGRIGRLERDMERALEFGKLACDLNIPQSCANVARMYKIGDGIPKNPDLAKEYADRAKAMFDVITKGETPSGFTG
ncbi:Sel1 repeat protein [Aphelenchoides fujianensis]|nr:Sel1 repeat protein [Aphelenchoides fujianensis]